MRCLRLLVLWLYFFFPAKVHTVDNRFIRKATKKTLRQSAEEVSSHTRNSRWQSFLRKRNDSILPQLPQEMHHSAVEGNSKRHTSLRRNASQQSSLQHRVKTSCSPGEKHVPCRNEASKKLDDHRIAPVVFIELVDMTKYVVSNLNNFYGNQITRLTAKNFARPAARPNISAGSYKPNHNVFWVVFGCCVFGSIILLLTSTSFAVLSHSKEDTILRYADSDISGYY